MPGSKDLNPHRLAHKWMKDLGPAPTSNTYQNSNRMFHVKHSITIFLYLLSFKTSLQVLYDVKI